MSTPEQPNLPPPEQRPNQERELTQEQIDLVMKKVIDLRENGYGYSSLGVQGLEAVQDVLPNVTKYGLLGSLRKKDDTNPAKWAENAKQRHGRVFINIRGRDESNGRLTWPWGGHGSYFIVFDLTSFKEGPRRRFKKYSGPGYKAPEQPRAPFRYQMDEGVGDDRDLLLHDKETGAVIGRVDEKELTVLDASGNVIGTFDDVYPNTREAVSDNEAEFGFILFPRVAPRWFRAIVIDPKPDLRPLTDEEAHLYGSRNDEVYTADGQPGKSFDEFCQEKGIKLSIGAALTALREGKEAYTKYEALEKEAFEEWRKISGYTYAEQAPHNYQNEVARIVEMMRVTYGDDVSKYIPIYDKSGNLWWPKEMTNEEVTKFVAERDKNIAP